ncbi:tRNA adenosine(34) deaminase TadA [Candidatus Legionella polyplacis]|uniref:tRNA-specific adenosine deaminase n=1 Tax=Candidatus Legionella polyplacis TaxID=2005262 RepID=A0ABZ2GZY5_9GAMM
MGIVYRKNDFFWMKKAYNFALIAKNQGEVPVGSVITTLEQTLVGYGWNQVLQKCDPCAHAEMNAIRLAALNLKNYKLLDTMIYTTLEPCYMCAGAIIQSRIGRIVFSLRNIKNGACGSICNLFNSNLLNYKVKIDEGILELECSKLLKDFFDECRKL